MNTKHPSSGTALAGATQPEQPKSPAMGNKDFATSDDMRRAAKAKLAKALTGRGDLADHYERDIGY